GSFGEPCTCVPLLLLVVSGRRTRRGSTWKRLVAWFPSVGTRGRRNSMHLTSLFTRSRYLSNSGDQMMSSGGSLPFRFSRLIQANGCPTTGPVGLVVSA